MDVYERITGNIIIIQSELISELSYDASMYNFILRRDDKECKIINFVNSGNIDKKDIILLVIKELPYYNKSFEFFISDNCYEKDDPIAINGYDWVQKNISSLATILTFDEIKELYKYCLINDIF